MIAALPEPLTFPDLGVTVAANPDGTAVLDLGWFGKKTITTADIAALKSWLSLLDAAKLGE
jgi:hypothetical protein